MTGQWLDLQAAGGVWRRHIQQHVQAARAQQGGVYCCRAIGRRQHQDACTCGIHSSNRD